MFILELFDRLGQKLSQGDIVKISDGRHFKFYAEVKWLEQEQVIAPFDTFSFHSFVKVDKLPDNVKQSTEERYKIWWVIGEDADESYKQGETYLMRWRNVEDYTEKGVYKIRPM